MSHSTRGGASHGYFPYFCPSASSSNRIAPWVLGSLQVRLLDGEAVVLQPIRSRRGAQLGGFFRVRVHCPAFNRIHAPSSCIRILRPSLVPLQDCASIAMVLASTLAFASGGAGHNCSTGSRSPPSVRVTGFPCLRGVDSNWANVFKITYRRSGVIHRKRERVWGMTQFTD